MASRLPQPSSASKLKPPSRLPAFSSSASKRLASDPLRQEPPSKKIKENGSTSGGMGPPTSRAVPGTRKMIRRSVSMASLPVSNAIKSKARAGVVPSSSSLTRSAVSNSSLNIAGNGVARRAGTNITSRVNNSKTPVVRKPTSSIPPPDKSRTKRKPWDLKGQLQDQEEVIGGLMHDKKEISDKVELIEKRLNELTQEKQSLTTHLSETENVKKAKLEELESFQRKFKELEESSESTIKQLKNSLEDMELKLERKERQNKELQTEVDMKVEELVQLKKSLCEVNSSKSVMESELSASKNLLSDREKRIEELERQLTDAQGNIVELKDKVRTGEEMRKQLHNRVQELKGNIRVFCRIRPLIGDEISNNGGSEEIYHLNVLSENSLELIKDGTGCDSSSMSGLKGRSNGAVEFSYDRVFGPKDSQKDVFEEVSQLVQSALDGYNVCVFAYGQTGSGKTFTMEGAPDDYELAGIIPRTVDFIYEHINLLSESGWQYTIQASFLEIYNETIRDLLVSPSEAKNVSYDIKMADAKSPHTHVSNLTIVNIDAPSDIYSVLRTARQHRAVAATNMNLQSSRSHSVFRMVLSGTNAKTNETCLGSLNLVDLAGSERLKESGSTGARLTETQNINKSLSNLSNVIMALGQKQNHIPYRNSKLTHLLQPSLGGNSKTLMLVNVSPLDACVNESLNSLRFAAKVNACHIGAASKMAKKV